MNASPIFIIFILVTCGAISFLMSGMEAGVLALSRLRIRQMKRSGHHRAEILYRFLERPENFLWTILVGNTISNFIFLSVSVLALMDVLKGQPFFSISAFFIIIFFFYTLCELLPKVLFRKFPNRLCLFLAGPFRFIHLILAPLVALMSWFSRGLLRWTGGKKFTGHLFGNRDELRLLMQESAGDLSSEERVMINRVLDLQSLTVGEITTPMDKITTVPAQMSVSDVMKLFNERQLKRFPVWKNEGTGRRIIGVINRKHLIFQSNLDVTKTAGDIVKPALYLEEKLRLEEALRRMQRSGQRIAIVLGADQRETGIITLQDVFKSIFGEVKL